MIKKAEPKHTCIACGCTQSKRNWWYYILKNDPDAKNIKQSDRKILVDMILYYMREKKQFNNLTT